MELQSLSMHRCEHWEPTPGAFKGDAIFSSELGKVTIKLDETACHQILQICAQQICTMARDISENLRSETLIQLDAPHLLPE